MINDNDGGNRYYNVQGWSLVLLSYRFIKRRGNRILHDRYSNTQNNNAAWYLVQGDLVRLIIYNVDVNFTVLHAPSTALTVLFQRPPGRWSGHSNRTRPPSIDMTINIF